MARYSDVLGLSEREDAVPEVSPTAVSVATVPASRSPFFVGGFSGIFDPDKLLLLKFGPVAQKDRAAVS